MNSLDSIRFDDAAGMTVRHPVTGDPLLRDDGSEMTITLTSRDSPQYRAQLVEFQRRLTEAGKRAATPDELENHTLRTLAACTQGWTLQNDSGDLPFSAAAALQVYAEKRWLREQADAFIAERANFLSSSLRA